jgi:hypothetical protein
VIQYEGSGLPEITIAPADFDIPTAVMWVRFRQEPLMKRDGDGHWVLVFVAQDNSVQIESPAFWRITDVHVAAARMRTWLDRQGLLAPS